MTLVGQTKAAIGGQLGEISASLRSGSTPTICLGPLRVRRESASGWRRATGWGVVANRTRGDRRYRHGLASTWPRRDWRARLVSPVDLIKVPSTRRSAMTANATAKRPAVTSGECGRLSSLLLAPARRAPRAAHCGGFEVARLARMCVVFRARRFRVSSSGVRQSRGGDERLGGRRLPPATGAGSA